MNHKEFVEAYKQGVIRAHIDENAALELLKKTDVKKGDRYAHLLWKRIFPISIPIGIVLGVWVNKWLGVAAIIMGFILSRSYKVSTSELVIARALKNEQLYNDLVELEIISVEHIH